MARNSATAREACMFLATDFSIALKGVVVPRSSSTVVPAASAAAIAAGAAAGAGAAAAPLLACINIEHNQHILVYQSNAGKR